MERKIKEWEGKANKHEDLMLLIGPHCRNLAYKKKLQGVSYQDLFNDIMPKKGINFIELKFVEEKIKHVFNFESPMNDTFYEIVFFDDRSKVKTSEYEKKIKALFPEYEIDEFQSDDTAMRLNMIKGKISEDLKEELEAFLHTNPEITDIELSSHLNNVFPKTAQYKRLADGIIIELFDKSGKDCRKLDGTILKEEILPMIKWTVPLKTSNNNEKVNFSTKVSSKVPREGFYDEEMLVDSNENLRIDNDLIADQKEIEEMLDQERIEAEHLEKERIEAERLEKEEEEKRKKEKEKQERKEKIQKEMAERKRIEDERIREKKEKEEREKREREEQERLEREEKERLDREEKERLERE